MNISIELTGVLRHSELGRNFTADFEEKATVISVLNYLQYPVEHHKFISTFVNGKQVDSDFLLTNNDQVKLFLPVGGG
ncbi:MAG: MoaD/ThiS family protein [bacterium]|jgi:hypothetical protein|nr:MoaD/ThiS family protein [bacterium]